MQEEAELPGAGAAHATAGGAGGASGDGDLREERVLRGGPGAARTRLQDGEEAQGHPHH